MQMFKRSVSILLAVLIVCSVFTAVPLSASAADKRIAKTAWENEERYLEGYSAGEAAAEQDFSTNRDNPGATTCDNTDDTDYMEGWERGYGEKWSQLEDENPTEPDDPGEAPDYTEEGRSAGDTAGYDDYDSGKEYGTTQCPVSPEDDVNNTYEGGWNEGYDEGWRRAEEQWTLTRDQGYTEGQDAANYDWNNGYTENHTQPDPRHGSEYVEGWNDGYSSTWYNLEEDEFFRFALPGYLAAQSDWDNEYEYGHTTYNMIYDDDNARRMWQQGYDMRWNMLESSYSENIIDRGTYSYYWGNGTLTFVSGTFTGSFFEDEQEELSRSSVMFISAKSGVSFSGDCSGMLSQLTNCNSISLNNVDTSAVTNMAEMFKNDYKVAQISVNGWDTSNVESMESMFEGCNRVIFLNLGHFNTSKVKCFVQMFRGCNDMAQLDFSGFTFGAEELYMGMVPGHTGMLYNTNLACIKAPANVAIDAYFGLHQRGGWKDLEGDGTIISTQTTLEIPELITTDVSTIPASSEVKMYCVDDLGFKFFTETGHSLSLNGDFAVNFYIDFGGYVAGYNWLEFFPAKIEFDWYNKHYEHRITSADYDPETGWYKIPCRVAAAEMNYPIRAKMTYMDRDCGGWINDTYSVREYGDVILDASSDFSVKYVNDNGADKYDKLTDLVKKMLDYGAKAQTVFDRTDVALANHDIDYTMTEITADTITPQKGSMKDGLADLGLEYQGTTVVFLSTTTLRHYYSIVDQAKFDAVKGSANFTYKDDKLSSGVIYFEKTDIPAAELDEVQSFEIGGKTYNYSVLDYSRSVIKSSAMTPAEKQLAMATYWFNDAANKFFSA